MIALAPKARRVTQSKATQGGPIVRWAGGKTRLLPELLARMPTLAPDSRYYEPFAGGAALFFALASRRAGPGDARPNGETRDTGQPGATTRPWAVIGDANPDLVGMYRAVAGDVEGVIAELEGHAADHERDREMGRRRKADEGLYYDVRRAWNSRSDLACAWSPVEQAAALLYLNRACFNGLWRVNRAGKFNVPVGRKADKSLQSIEVRPEQLRLASTALAGAEIRCGDYLAALADVRPGDLVYFDPPYDGTWTGYTAGGFREQEQRHLAAAVRSLANHGVHVMLSSSDTPLIRELYAWARLDVVRCPRAINSNGAGRGEVDELIVRAGPADTGRVGEHPNTQPHQTVRAQKAQFGEHPDQDGRARAAGPEHTATSSRTTCRSPMSREPEQIEIRWPTVLR